MRTHVLILIFAFPPLLACGAAYAKTSADFGKPVCSHYDDAAKPASPAGSDPAAATSATAPATTTVATGTTSATAQSRSGGTASMTHPRSAPHWQTFLPGMFR